MQDKKQIIGLILSVVLSVGLVVIGVNAATTVGNAVSVGSTLDVVATTTLSATTTIAGTVILTDAADLIVGLGTSTFAGDVTVSRNLVASDDLAVTGTTTLSSGLTVANNLVASDDLSVAGTTTLSRGLTVAHNIVASDDLSVVGYTTTTGGLSIGGGLVISKLYSTSTAIDFGVIAALACATSSTSLTGVAAGDAVVLGVPNAVAAATSTVMWNAWAPATDTVYVRVCNVGNSSPTPDFASGTFRIDVWQH